MPLALRWAFFMKIERSCKHGVPRFEQSPVAHANPRFRFSVPSGDAERIGDAFRYRRGELKQAVWH